MFRAGQDATRDFRSPWTHRSRCRLPSCSQSLSVSGSTPRLSPHDGKRRATTLKPRRSELLGQEFSEEMSSGDQRSSAVVETKLLVLQPESTPRIKGWAIIQVASITPGLAGSTEGSKRRSVSTSGVRNTLPRCRAHVWALASSARDHPEQQQHHLCVRHETYRSQKAMDAGQVWSMPGSCVLATRRDMNQKLPRGGEISATLVFPRYVVPAMHG